MSGTFLHFPKTYEVDDYYFSVIACMIRHEFVENRSQYMPDGSLALFVADMEKHGWEYYAAAVVDMSRYCASQDTNGLLRSFSSSCLYF
jgi:hypothetical protein